MFDNTHWVDIITLCHLRKAKTLLIGKILFYNLYLCKIAIFSLRTQNILLHFPSKTLMKQLGIEKYGNYITYLLHSSMESKLKSQALKQVLLNMILPPTSCVNSGKSLNFTVSLSSFVIQEWQWLGCVSVSHKWVHLYVYLDQSVSGTQ